MARQGTAMRRTRRRLLMSSSECVSLKGMPGRNSQCPCSLQHSQGQVQAAAVCKCAWLHTYGSLTGRQGVDADETWGFCAPF